MTRCNMSDRIGWVESGVHYLALAVVATIFAGAGQSAFAVGLTYVDGRPGSSFGEPANIFRSNGSSLGTPGSTDVFTSEANVDTDNAWGWRDFGATNVYYDPTPGVVDLDYASVYESSGNAGQEDSPEFMMKLVGGAPDGLGGTINIANSTAYDVYVAYWSDASGNWAIRGGTQPGSMATPLPVFANFSTAVAGDTQGRFASSAAWDNPPLDNPTDENATGATDNNTNPFLDVTPGAPVTSNRNMLLGYLGTVTSGSQAGAASNEIRVWIDDLPALNNGGGGRRSWFDGLAFVPAGTNVFWSAEVNRDAGTLSVTNDTSQSFTVVGYSILSTAGSLDGSGANNAPWNNLTAGTLPEFTDTDDDWAVVGTPTALSTELREQDGLTGSQNGIVVAPGGELDLGAIWQLAPFEDVQIVLRLADATPGSFDDNPVVTIFPTYSGTAAVRGDFTGDGSIDVNDYISLMQNLHKPQGTLARTAYYRNGDFNDDNMVDRNDFFLFRNAYFQANPGAGAEGFAAMAADAARIMGLGVPEPSSLCLIGLGGGLLCVRSRRRNRHHTDYRNSAEEMRSMKLCRMSAPRLSSATLALFVIVGVLSTSTSEAVPVIDWQCDDLSGNCNPGLIFGGDTNSPTFGDGSTNSADDWGVWGATPSNVHLDTNFEAVLSGRILMTGADPGNGRDFRWGMWKRVDNGAPDPSGAWVGYMAEGGNGGTPGRLQVRNPDDPAFSTASFLSDFGGGSIATTSGPAPEAGPGTQFTDFNNQGTGTGRYFLLAEPPVTNNAAYDPNIWYTFEIRVGRYGDEVDVSGSLVADPIAASGDYNNDNVVDAADYTVWRDRLGQPASNLPNRDPANTATTIDVSHYNDWKANFGATGGTPFELKLGGGLDFDGRPPAALDPDTMEPVPFTSHLTFDFDRVGFLFGNQMNAEQVELDGVDISVRSIETLDLHVNTTTGEVQIRNNLTTPLSIDYYEITSTLGVLESDNWTSLDAADGGLPVTNDYLTGWDVAEGSSDFVLSEGNFVGSSTVTMGTPISLGNVFKTGTTVGDRDIRFFAGLAGGGVIRGTVTYSASGLGSLTVPEPGTIWLLLAVWGRLLIGRRRVDRNVS